MVNKFICGKHVRYLLISLTGKYAARTHTGVAADLTTGADERTRRPGVASDMTSIGEHASESVLPF